MFRNYLKTAYRSITRNLSQTLINIIGLSIGMTCALMIFLWVSNELSYDKWQNKAERIYRLELDTWVVTPPILTDIIGNLPEIEEYVRFYFWWEPTLNYNDKAINMKNLAIVDSTVFKIFNFSFIKGNPETAFKNSNSIVLTKTLAKAFFGNEEPMGKIILYENKYPIKVTGIIDDISKFHMELNALIPNQLMVKINGNNSLLKSGSCNFLTHFLLKPNTNIPLFTEKINDIVNKFIKEKFNSTEKITLLLRPFKEIYFARGLPNERFVKHGNIQLVYIFSIISVLIILIACINFINITTARANLRMKEISIRKVVGSSRGSLVLQFMIETFILVLFAHIISIVLLEFSLPVFNSFISEKISINYLSGHFIGLTLGMIILVTLISGFYPSIYLSSFKPLTLLKGNNKKEKGSLRKALIIFQIAVSISLVITTILIIKQLNYVLNKDLGYNQENIVMFDLKGKNITDNVEETLRNKTSFNQELQKNPRIKDVFYIGQLLGCIQNTENWIIKGVPYNMRTITSDPSFIETLGIKLIAGRNFSIKNSTDMNGKVIINETAVKFLGLDNPVGSFYGNGHNDEKIEIIGVVKDFNFNSLHNKIEPVAISWNYWTSKVCVKVARQDIPGTIDYIKTVYEKYCPNYPFEYSFLDETFNKQYFSEIKTSKIAVFFALIAITIAGLGLFGMSSFMVTTRTKEIGVRKSLGATELQIISLFYRTFLNWLVIAFIVSAPVAYILLKKWLEQYPYQTNISWWIFLVAFLTSIFISLISAGYQVLKAAYSNPSNSLRYE